VNPAFADTFYWVALIHRKDAARAVRRILSAAGVHVVAQSRQGFLEGLDLYEARPDKGYSLADCVSMQTMRRKGIMDVLTNDRHFEQEGFRAIFRSS
jgi:predicted nucleic acid-binding protein